MNTVNGLDKIAFPGSNWLSVGTAGDKSSHLMDSSISSREIRMLSGLMSFLQSETRTKTLERLTCMDDATLAV